MMDSLMLKEKRSFPSKIEFNLTVLDSNSEEPRTNELRFYSVVHSLCSCAELGRELVSEKVKSADSTVIGSKVLTMTPENPACATAS